MAQATKSLLGSGKELYCTLNHQSSNLQTKLQVLILMELVAKTSLFKHGADAWSILYPMCVQKLTKLYKAGYKLVIFTNQAAIGKAKATKEKVIAEKKGRLAGFVNKVGYT